MEDGGVEKVEAIYLGNMTSGTINQQRHLGALVADFLGQKGAEAVKMEAACGSAGSESTIDTLGLRGRSARKRAATSGC